MWWGDQGRVKSLGQSLSSLTRKVFYAITPFVKATLCLPFSVSRTNPKSSPESGRCLSLRAENLSNQALTPKDFDWVWGGGIS